MAGEAHAEKALLDAIAADLAAEGYSVFLEPSRNLLPKSFAGVRLDAVALSDNGNIAIEVVTKSASSTEKLMQLKHIVEQEPGWSLKVVFAPPYGQTLSIGAIDDSHLDSALADAEALANDGKTSAALLLAWAALEAAGRRLLVNSSRRPQASIGLLSAMAEEGLLTREEFNNLRQFADVRNRVAHGDLALAVGKEALHDLFKVISNLRQTPKAA